MEELVRFRLTGLFPPKIPPIVPGHDTLLQTAVSWEGQTLSYLQRLFQIYKAGVTTFTI